MMARAAASTSEAECTDAVVTLKMQTDLAHRRESMYECRAATHPVHQNTRTSGAKGAVHVDKFGTRFAHCAKATRRKPGSTWHLDEMFVTLRGEPYLLW
jgi:hypothetical protein